MQMKMRRAENIFLLFLLLVGAAVFYGSSRVRLFFPEPMSAKSYGMIISGAFSLLCLVRLGSNLLAGLKRKADSDCVIQEKWKLLLVIILSLAYCFGISYVGYFTSTFIFIAAMFAILSGTRDPKRIVRYVFYSVAFNLAFYFLFRVMKVFMPNTPLP